jgi:hypothetical protein
LDPKEVIGDAFGPHNRYNTLLCMFWANIAPSAGNLDGIREGIVNLMIYSHQLFCEGETTEVTPLDDMDFNHQELYECIINKKASCMLPL